MRYLIFTCITFLFFNGTAFADTNWPVVKERQIEYVYDGKENNNGIDTYIYDEDGKKLYSLSCHSGDYEKDDYFSGLIDCRLNSLYSRDTISSLFAQKLHGADWETRGRFLTDHIRPICRDYPEWGSKRTFNLRGMIINLTLADAIFGNESTGRLITKSYKLRITIKNNQTSKTEISETPSVPEPAWFYKDAKCE